MAPDRFAGLTVSGALRAGALRLEHSKTPMLDARVLLQFAAGFDDADVIARSSDVLTQQQAEDFSGFIERRARCEPVAYITGAKEFWSLDIRVTPDTLIPRDDSECLIEAVIARRSTDDELSVLDLGTGSGCLLSALLHEFQHGHGVGVDQSERAITVAQENARNLGLTARTAFMAGDWLDAIAGQFDIIIANPPYIPSRDMASLPADIFEFEPARALVAGPSGFDDYRAILVEAPRVLAPGGLLIVEAGDGQAEALCGLVEAAFPHASTSIVNDLKGSPRGVLADLKSTSKKD